MSLCHGVSNSIEKANYGRQGKKQSFETQIHRLTGEACLSNDLAEPVQPSPSDFLFSLGVGVGERKEDGREEMNQGRLAEMAILKKQEEYVLRTVSGSFRGNWSAVGRRYSEAPTPHPAQGP